MRKLAALFLLLWLAPAAAATHATPALWHIKGPQGDVTLLGSIHLLPPDVDWHTKPVKAAIARADVFVFEVSNEEPAMDRMRALIQQHGFLEPGQSLRALLSEEARKNYDAAMAKAHLDPAMTDLEKPWLVSLQLLVAEGKQANYSPEAGVDRAVMAEASAAHKSMRYLETVEQQFALLAPADEELQIHSFESDLEDFNKGDEDLDKLYRAWASGDAAQLGRLMNEGLEAHPDVREELLDARNRRWAAQIQTMLREKRRFFITVGAGHLSGPTGVPALLRKAGYTVTGP